ncbi:PAS domain-containing protein [Streptomyces sp. NPDC046942]|uniref:PAS domain-containing protein n=1 Tax=Streptomyces sp. NPDC046942 TaxID=3155137 RepID=UPI00340B54BA
MIDTTRALFDRAWTPILVTDPAGIVRDANPSAARLTGRPTEVLTGTLLRHLIPHEVCALLGARRVARPDGYVDATAALARADGQWVPVRIVTWPAGPPGGNLICCLIPLIPSAATPPAQRRPRPASSPVTVTAPEARILEGLALGLTNADLSRTLHLSRQGLDYRIGRLRRKLAAGTRPALVARAYVVGLLDIAAWPPRARFTATGAAAAPPQGPVPRQAPGPAAEQADPHPHTTPHTAPPPAPSSGPQPGDAPSNTLVAISP